MTPADPCPAPVRVFCSCTELRAGPHLQAAQGLRRAEPGEEDRGRGQACFTRTDGKAVAPSRAETPGLACTSLRILEAEGAGLCLGGGRGTPPGTRRVTRGGVGAAHTHPTVMPRAVPWCRAAPLCSELRKRSEAFPGEQAVSAERLTWSTVLLNMVPLMGRGGVRPGPGWKSDRPDGRPAEEG